MYSRGQFAIIGKVGRKALRIYHEEGLLVPAFINGENGYHYYDESQLAVLEKIKRLRKIGLSLYEIKLVLKGKATEKELVESKIREMDSRLQEARELANEKEATTPNEKATPDILIYGVYELLVYLKLKVMPLWLASPILKIVVAILLLFNQKGTLDWIFVVCGVILCLEGVFSLIDSLANKKAEKEIKESEKEVVDL